MAVSLIGGGNRSTRRKTRPAASHGQTYHKVLYQVHIALAGIELTTLVVIDTDCIGSYKSNYVYHLKYYTGRNGPRRLNYWKNYKTAICVN